ncbi:MAG: ATP-binding protein [Kiritimatiellae bacterium]|nr:ATP-binding protein [Kiritimatiellia bacterium]
MSVYKRENYLRPIRGFYHDSDLIKVITGVRRCGKSCLMESIAQELHENGIDDNHIVYLDLDLRKYRKIKTVDQLEKLIDERTPKEGLTYLFIDEVQNVTDFEEVVNAFREEGRHSIFITGSNSYLLSGELITKLTGRYIEFEMFPLTFDEYLGMKEFLGKTISHDVVAEFDEFLRQGGFPKALQYDNPEDRKTYISSVIAEIFQKDIKKRIKIRNVAAFQSVQTYLINNFGATTSLTNLLEDMDKSGIHIKRETLNRYITILKDAKILCECNRFDLKSRRSIGGEQKFYLSDLGFYFATNTDNRINFGPTLENIVYIYARAHGYSVSIGRIGALECDFIFRRGDADYAYAQVAMTITADKATEDREYNSLEKIRDNYPKFVLTRNDIIQRRNGIIHENLPDFMKQSRAFSA